MKKRSINLLVAIGLAGLMSLGWAQTVKLAVWSGYPEMEPFYRHVADAFIAEHPNVEIEILTQPLRDYERKLLASVPTGTAGDILEIAANTASPFLNAGLLKPMPADIADFVRGSAYNPFYAERASFEGTVYGVPLFRGMGVLFYNTDMFAAAGLAGPPTTQEEYLDFAQKLTQRDANGNPVVSGWSLRLSGGGAGVAEKFWTIMHQYGGAVIRETADGGWVNGYDNDAGRATLQLYVDLVNKYKVVTPELKSDAEGFELGATAMFQRESWVIGDIADKAPDLNYATAPLPRGTISLPVNLYVTNDKPEAFEFAQYLVKPEFQVWLLENVGWLPNRQDVDYQVVLDKIPQLDAFLNVPEGHVLFTLPGITPLDEILTRLAERLVDSFVNASLVDNPEGIAKVIHDAASETDQILKREGMLGTP